MHRYFQILYRPISSMHTAIHMHTHMTCTHYPFSSYTQVPYGIGMAAGIRVGNMLGAGEPGKAKKSAVVAFCFACKYFVLQIKNLQIFILDYMYICLHSIVVNF